VDAYTDTVLPIGLQTGYLGGAFYEQRGITFLPFAVGFPTGRTVIEPEMANLRGDRGLASTGEIMLLDQPGQGPPGYIDRITGGSADDRIYDQYWRRDMGSEPSIPDQFSNRLAAKPFWNGPGGAATQVSQRISTDRMDEYDWANSTLPFGGTPIVRTRPDTTAGDVEEQNMLFAGASNIVTTRSDTFTVYFRVRSFRQNTSVSPPVWDATNKEYIVDDSRYVMLIDRSTVNRPSDKPKILYLEKLTK
jgi:hypothetical protein